MKNTLFSAVTRGSRRRLLPLFSETFEKAVRTKRVRVCSPAKLQSERAVRFPFPRLSACERGFFKTRASAPAFSSLFFFILEHYSRSFSKSQPFFQAYKRRNRIFLKLRFSRHPELVEKAHEKFRTRSICRKPLYPSTPFKAFPLSLNSSTRDSNCA